LWALGKQHCGEVATDGPMAWRTHFLT